MDFIFKPKKHIFKIIYSKQILAPKMKIDPKLVLQTLQLILLFACVICDALRDLVSVTIWRLYGRSNACECMLTLFYFPVVCIRLHELAWCSTGSINLTS